MLGGFLKLLGCAWMLFRPEALNLGCTLETLGSRKTSQCWAPPPRDSVRAAFGEAQALVFFQSSPGVSNMHLGLRTIAVGVCIFFFLVANVVFFGISRDY